MQLARDHLSFLIELQLSNKLPWIYGIWIALRWWWFSLSERYIYIYIKREILIELNLNSIQFNLKTLIPINDYNCTSTIESRLKTRKIIGDESISIS